MTQDNKKSSSPYNKYDKKPYRYSTLYNDWQAARKAGREDETRRLGIRHTQHWLGDKVELKEAA